MRIYHKPRVFAWVDTETTGVGPLDVPIQIGVILTDEHLNELAEHQALIQVSATVEHEFLNPTGSQWRSRAQNAFNVHGISPQDLLDRGVPPATAVNDLREFIAPFLSDQQKPIMVSDNPVFDEQMLRTLYWQAGVRRADHWPFHYSAWSPVMLWASLGLPKYHKPHNALGDVRAMLDHTQAALQIVENMKTGTPDHLEVDFSDHEIETGVNTAVFLDDAPDPLAPEPPIGEDAPL